jgi:Uncharacterized protein involved in exopolysaccharide biosynthesis
MSIINFIRLIRKHIVLLIVAPIFLAILVLILTRNPNYKYSSETTLFTGIATGSSVEMDKSFNYFVTNTAFDNLINVVKSRNTQQEVAIRLLSQHLLMSKPDPTYISSENFDKLKKITPAYIYKYVAKIQPDTFQKSDTLKKAIGVRADLSMVQPEIPEYMDKTAYEITVENLTKLMESSDTNFVYKLLNYPNDHYSFKDISSVKVTRIGSSDMIQLKYETDDPGICQQTLALLTNACIRNYKIVKETRSDAVIKYFEKQLEEASGRLKIAEDKLLEFNKENNIINYYEQSKAVAVVKEDIEVEFYNKKIKLAGLEAAISRLEEKLTVQEQIQLKSSNLLQLRTQLGDLNFRIATAETFHSESSEDFKNLSMLKSAAQKIEDQLKKTVGDLYTYKNSREGLPISTILNEWIGNVVEAENVKAGIKVLDDRIKEFQKQYSIYAPAGANIKRIEREISVSEQEFLEILHGLNLAKLKLQDNELSANIKVVDPPYFPLSPIPTKRKILIILAALVGFVFVLASVLFAEYFDETLKNQTHAAKILKMAPLGMVPRIVLKSPVISFSSITERLLNLTIQNIEQHLSAKNNAGNIILIYSNQKGEGKSVVAANLANQLKNQGKKVLYLNYSDQDNTQTNVKKKAKNPIISRLLGYPDNRINYESSFLDKPENYLNKDEYLIYDYAEMHRHKNLTSFLAERNIESINYDFIFIEIPPIIHHQYPSAIMAQIDLPVLVCRANRIWSEADHLAADSLQKITQKPNLFILNGVELAATETVLGELAKKRSKLRKAIKKIVQLQFLTRNQI